MLYVIIYFLWQREYLAYIIAKQRERIPYCNLQADFQGQSRLAKT